MGELYDLKAKIEKVIAIKKLDPIKTKGAISLKVGFVVSLIFPYTPDDPEKITKLRDAAKLILKEVI